MESKLTSMFEKPPKYSEKTRQIKKYLSSNVNFYYIPKLEGKIGREYVDFLAELKAIETAYIYKHIILSCNALYLVFLAESQFEGLRKLRLLALFIPVMASAFARVTSSKETEKIMKPLFDQEFQIYKKLAWAEKQKSKATDNDLDSIHIGLIQFWVIMTSQ